MSRTPRPVRRQPGGETRGPGAARAVADSGRLAAGINRPEPVVPLRSGAGFAAPGVPNRTRTPRIGPAGQIGRQAASGKRTQVTPSMRKGVRVGPEHCESTRSHANVRQY